MKIYHNPRCTKSRETLGIIESANAKVEIVEYLKTPPTKSELVHLLKLLDLNPSEIIRKGEPVYKEQFKGKTLTEEQWIDAMLEYPKLIERPIVVKGEQAVLGRPPENVNKLL